MVTAAEALKEVKDNDSVLSFRKKLFLCQLPLKLDDDSERRVRSITEARANDSARRTSG